jgi:hypothetical protein
MPCNCGFHECQKIAARLSVNKIVLTFKTGLFMIFTTEPPRSSLRQIKARPAKAGLKLAELAFLEELT